MVAFQLSFQGVQGVLGESEVVKLGSMVVDLDTFSEVYHLICHIRCSPLLGFTKTHLLYYLEH